MDRTAYSEAELVGGRLSRARLAEFRWHELLRDVTLSAALDMPRVHIEDLEFDEPGGLKVYRVRMIDKTIPCPCGCGHTAQLPVDILLVPLEYGWYRVEGITRVYTMACAEGVSVFRVPEFHARTWGNEW